jgi:hypothetical protein
MKIFISTFAVALALAFTGPAFAGDVTTAKTEADCQKAGGMWDAKMHLLREEILMGQCRLFRTEGVGFGRRPFCWN